MLHERIGLLDKGYVKLIDFLGSDERVVQAARTSYNLGTKTEKEDRALIDYLMRHRHTSPFEQVVLTFEIKLPLFVAIHFLRHRTARVNANSGRYMVMKDEFYVPDPKRFRKQSKTNKQQSSDAVAHNSEVLAFEMGKHSENCYAYYEHLLDCEVAREVARLALPQNIYVKLFWQIDLHNLFHFLTLRMDNHAQYETEQYAQVIAQAASFVAPNSYESWENHVYESVTFSRDELDLLRTYLNNPTVSERVKQSTLPNGRQRELLEKLSYAVE